LVRGPSQNKEEGRPKFRMAFLLTTSH